MYGGSAYGGGAHADYGVYSPPSKSKSTSKKGGIRGMLDTLNSRIAPGIAKNV